jgi:hypothetical protein
MESFEQTNENEQVSNENKKDHDNTLNNIVAIK